MRTDRLQFNSHGLAPYASQDADSKGRLVSEPTSPTRSEFQRDRDRIIHSAAFRRLQFKTQVFVLHEGDHFRTRLTHTIEVAQVARSIARNLKLDIDLAEAIALAHDLGHSPFGHAGERALDAKMQGYGGFDHNAQSLRVVTRLERRYAGFDGLNLTWETLEGIVKHNGPLLDAHGNPAGDYAGKTIPGAITEFDALFPLRLDSFASLEAQAAAVSDDIAYNAHDVDDGLRAGLFTLDDIAGGVEIVGMIVREVDRIYPHLDRARRIHETFRRLITIAIEDVQKTAASRLGKLHPASAESVRATDAAIIGFSDSFLKEVAVLRTFLFERMYRHPHVNATMNAAAGIIGDLFDTYFADTELMPQDWRAGTAQMDETRRARRVADYIAGMTDRYAISEHRRLFDHTPDLR
ncbi:deoxyguanosinetriphosphate triphosphohydrolase [Tepidamorphus sp. 3E244]|uniref:deoxyguanosinetriphosphate triphosphohydrolase n=1 Tax=Tepidamorphus sp. 3E244 TaxID=3385498 RepID=UPI0038FC594A